AGPKELAVCAATEPVDRIHARGLRHAVSHLQPMIEVIAHVVAAKRQHGKRIAPYLAHLAGGGSRGLRSHGRGGIDAIGPVERFVYERHRGSTTTPEDKRRNRHAV